VELRLRALVDSPAESPQAPIAGPPRLLVGAILAVAGVCGVVLAHHLPSLAGTLG
jgi:hypothetical protein